jgi:hypothetical protein
VPDTLPNVDVAVPETDDEETLLSDELGAWLGGPDTTLGGLVDLFGERSFALLFVVLMALPALPLPTGGATHVFEIVVALVALQLIAGRRAVWIPERWRGLLIAGKNGDAKFVQTLVKIIRRLERFSRPRFAFLFERRLTNIAFGVLVIGGCAGAFFAPPFSGLDTLPALGVVVMSLGVLLKDAVVAAAGIAIATLGVLVEILLGKALINWVKGLF